MSAGGDRDDVIAEFKASVNMSPKELQEWLGTEESKAAGQKDGGGESVGHESGRRIADLLNKKKADYTNEDVSHMRKVNGYISRHLAQRPSGDVSDTRWRQSLMNWGHDPLK